MILVELVASEAGGDTRRTKKNLEVEIVGTRPIAAPPKERFVAGSVIPPERLEQPNTDATQQLKP